MIKQFQKDPHLVRHMNSEHNAYYGLEYLLASCTMSEEERAAVKEVTRYA